MRQPHFTAVVSPFVRNKSRKSQVHVFNNIFLYQRWSPPPMTAKNLREKSISPNSSWVSKISQDYDVFTKAGWQSRVLSYWPQNKSDNKGASKVIHHSVTWGRTRAWMGLNVYVSSRLIWPELLHICSYISADILTVASLRPLVTYSRLLSVVT